MVSVLKLGLMLVLILALMVPTSQGIFFGLRRKFFPFRKVADPEINGITTTTTTTPKPPAFQRFLVGLQNLLRLTRAVRTGFSDALSNPANSGLVRDLSFCTDISQQAMPNVASFTCANIHFGNIPDELRYVLAPLFKSQTFKYACGRYASCVLCVSRVFIYFGSVLYGLPSVYCVIVFAYCCWPQISAVLFT